MDLLLTPFYAKEDVQLRKHGSQSSQCVSREASARNICLLGVDRKVLTIRGLNAWKAIKWRSSDGRWHPYEL